MLTPTSHAHLMPVYARQPISFVRGQGARLWDDRGIEYLDAIAGVAVTNLGHAHPEVAAAIADQATQLLHTPTKPGPCCAGHGLATRTSCTWTATASSPGLMATMFACILVQPPTESACIS